MGYRFKTPSNLYCAAGFHLQDRQVKLTRGIRTWCVMDYDSHSPYLVAARHNFPGQIHKYNELKHPIPNGAWEVAFEGTEVP